MPQAQQQVYVVDDDQGMLDSTVWLLESVGLTALPFTSGRDFLDACDGQSQGCVLLDVRMPGMGGLNVQEEMRLRELNLPVIFVSAHADVPIVVRAFKAGAVDFIEKPYNEQLLLDSVQQALSRADRIAGLGRCFRPAGSASARALARRGPAGQHQSIAGQGLPRRRASVSRPACRSARLADRARQPVDLFDSGIGVAGR